MFLVNNSKLEGIVFTQIVFVILDYQLWGLQKDSSNEWKEKFIKGELRSTR